MIVRSQRLEWFAVSCVFLITAATAAKAEDLADLIAPGANVEKLADGFQFTEGPARDKAGNVYFSDIPNGRIHVWSVDGELSTFREDSGRANGLYFDRRGNLLACEGGNRRLTATSPDGDLTVLAVGYNGKQLNSPNDLWIDPQGGIYFSDPRYGDQKGLEQDGFHVYYLAPKAKKLVRVLNDLVRPNGLVGTPDGKQLYVTDEGGDKTFVYQIGSNGLLHGRKLFAEKGSDGMTLDEAGHVYLTTRSVWVYRPDGELLGEIKVPEGAANVRFGGEDRQTLFITARKGLYAVRMNVRGI